jgi:hypothetical protein
MSENNSGVGLTTVLQMIFIILKLTGNIDWSWWWVLSPLWISILMAVLLLALFMLAGINYSTFMKK